MSPNRPLRASTNSNGRASKRLSADTLPVPRTRAGHQLTKVTPPSPGKVRKSAPPSPSKRQPSCPNLSPSRRNLLKPESHKKTPLKNTRKSPLKNSMIVKKSPRKLSSKDSSIESSPKKNIQTKKQASSGNNLQTTPKKVPSKFTLTTGKNVKTTPKKVTTRMTTSPGKNVKTTPKKVLPGSTTSLEKNVQTSPKKAHLKASTSIENSVKTTPKKGRAKAPVLNIRSPTRPISTRNSPQSKIFLPTSSPNKVFVKSSPTVTPNKVSNSPLKQKVSSSVSLSRSTRKRLLPSPSKSPQAAKRRLRGNILTPLHVKNEADSDDCVVLDKVSKIGLQTHPERAEINSNMLPDAPIQFKNPFLKKSGAALPSDPELSGRFLRRKWFSLKTRGGFTCLRSAILSPEEIAQEVIQHTMVETPKHHDANFFSTKLMVRLSSRLPPTRARPSCEELVDLINSKQTSNKLVEANEPRKEGTAIRVKVERRSFSDTISHVTSNPSKSNDGLAIPNGSQSQIGRAFVHNQGNLTKKEEREIALQQLKNLRYW